MKYISFILVFFLSSSCCGIRIVEKKAPLATATILNATQAETESIENRYAPGPANYSVAPNDYKSKNEILDDDSNLEKAADEGDQPNEAFDHSQWDALLKKHVSKQGNVNYKGFKKDWRALKEYIVSLGKNMPNASWRNADKLAYWINAYNALTVDLIVRSYPVKSIKDISNPWNQRLWKLGDKWYDLDEIEHKILRKMDEPRIHFAIVCASYSCPKLLNEAFAANALESQLTQVTKSFLADETRNSISENEIKLSKIFQWFSKDFEKNGPLIDFLNQYSEIKISPQAKKRFKNYNWDLNE